MSRLGIICGSALTKSGIFAKGSRLFADTEYGGVTIYQREKCFLLPRHGIETFLAPHQINNRANIAALSYLGVKRIISVCSVGSLNPEIPPGAFVLPDDVFCPWRRDTFFGKKNIGYSIPEVSAKVLNDIAEILWKRGGRFFKGGVYCQTLGPSFETKAEIRFLAKYGTVVGMTAAQEVFLACELKLPIGLLCMVDNYANGMSLKPLTIEKVLAVTAENGKQVEKTLEDIIDDWNATTDVG